uniref:Lysine-specific metallo-endopeptidase domain-containing protein n=1 Tax=Amphimedon queenslandica TaxID=400682 RepID=A0A1X7TZE1_AMPQE
MKTLLSLFCLVTYLTCALSANGWPFSLDMACNKALSAVACSFEFTNNANEDLYLLKRNTPLEGLRSQFVSVSLDGRPLKYEGMYVRRLPPTKKNFVLLEAGESISATVQITDIFSIDTDGLYTVQYSRPLQYLSVNEMSAMSIDQLRESIVRESVQLYLEDTSVLLKPKVEKVKIDYTVHLQDCSSASFSGGDKQKNETLEAHKKLCSGSGKAQGEVGNGIAISTTWFGVYSADRTNTARKTYEDIKNGLGNTSVTYYNDGPDCEAGDYAYVWSNIKDTVYLCDLYYNSQTLCSKSAESKEGTLLHEWSHSFAGTDYYGRDLCKQLARDDPDNAVKNADNYAYHYCDAQ